MAVEKPVVCVVALLLLLCVAGDTAAVMSEARVMTIAHVACAY